MGTNMDPKEMTIKTNHWFVMAVEAALGLRVLFRLFGAEAGSSGFVRWLYETTGVLMEPVRNVFQNQTVSSKYVLDFPAIFTMVGYMVLGLLVLNWANSWKNR